MRRIILFLMLSSLAWAGASSTVYEIDNSTQTNRPIWFGQAFATGEIVSGNCPRPSVGGTPVANGSWQADIKTTYGDGSVKFAIISFVATVNASSNISITYTSVASSSSCDGSGGKTGAQLATFLTNNSLDAGIVVASNGSTTVTSTMSTMLAQTAPESNTFGDCKNDYWARGPVMTVVIVQDCTATYTNDFGWSWNGTTMSSPVTTTSNTASLHPWFVLWAFSASNNAYVEAVVENDWISRRQDQSYALTITKDAAATTVYSRSTFTQIFGTRVHRSFWTGTSPGNIRIDPNFAYLKSTFALPNYDSGIASPSTGTNNSGDWATSWTQWTTMGLGDLMKEGSTYGAAYDQQKDYSSDGEGAVLQREDLLYLYNGTSCGTANSECAKAYQMLTATSGVNDTSLTAYNIAGGAGVWGMFNGIPFHRRETRTAATGKQTGTNFYYCDTFAAKDTTMNSTTCGGSGALNVAQGRTFSKYAHSGDQLVGFTNNPVAAVGTVSTNNWSANDSCAHWIDYGYVPYLLTGSPFWLDEVYNEAAWCAAGGASAGVGFGQNGNFFAIINTDATVRGIAWGLQTIGRAAYIAPDGSQESSYFTSILNSNLEFNEGFQNVTGTSLTPASTNSSCSTYTGSTSNRWDFGHCGAKNACDSSPCTISDNTLLHYTVRSICSVNEPNKIDYTKANGLQATWMAYMLLNSLAHLRELGFSNTASFMTAIQKELVEEVKDTDYNPYMIAVFTSPSRSGSLGSPASCGGGNPQYTSPYFQTYAAKLGAYSATTQAIASFNTNTTFYGNHPCDDHAYSLIARSAGEYFAAYPVTTSQTNCPAGSCVGSAAKTWLESNVPYNGNAADVAASCTATSTDYRVKWSIAARPVIVNDTCSISAPSNGATITTTPTTITVSCTAGQGSINLIQGLMDGSGTNMPSNAGTPLNSTFDGSLFSNGTHTIGCNSTDTGGGTGSCVPISVTINIAAAGASKTNTSKSVLGKATVK